jgi:hypothetical protein
VDYRLWACLAGGLLTFRGRRARCASAARQTASSPVCPKPAPEVEPETVTPCRASGGAKHGWNPTGAGEQFDCLIRHLVFPERGDVVGGGFTLAFGTALRISVFGTHSKLVTLGCHHSLISSLTAAASRSQGCCIPAAERNAAARCRAGGNGINPVRRFPAAGEEDCGGTGVAFSSRCCRMKRQSPPGAKPVRASCHGSRARKICCGN